jgi:hypothetical protein
MAEGERANLIVVSYPKSGRTWLRVMLDQAGIPAAYSHLGSSHKSARLLDDLTLEFDPAYPLRLALFRDPRDTVVSGYYQATMRLGQYQGTMSAFIREPGHGIERTAGFNLRLAELCSGHADCLMLTYEQMLADTAGVMLRAAAFAGHPIDAATAERIATDNTFERMQARERNGEYDEHYGVALRTRRGGAAEALKVRRGIAGGYRDELSAEDVAFVDEVVARTDYQRRMADFLA